MHKNQKGWRKVLNWQALQIGQQTHGENKSVRLLLGDVDAIKGFVYEGQKLPEIRGGSEMLVELEEDIREMFRQSLRDGCLVYCGGGSFLAIVPADEAEALKERIERMYLAKTGVATITVITSMPIGNEELVHGLLPHDETLIHQLQGVGVAEDLLFSHFEAVVPDRRERKNFGEWVARLSADLQKEKLAKCIAPFFPSLPFPFTNAVSPVGGGRRTVWILSSRPTNGSARSAIKSARKGASSGALSPSSLRSGSNAITVRISLKSPLRI